MTKMKLSEVAAKSGAALLATAAGTAATYAQDLSGPYVGLSYGIGRGGVDNIGSNDTYSFDGSSAGLFIGYNTVRGDWIIGGELAFASGFSVDDDQFGYGTHADSVIDIKARVGRVFGGSLVYGTIGYSQMDINFDDLSGANGTASGPSLGLGFETAIGDRGFVGGEVLVRSIDASPNPSFYMDFSRLTTASIRAGFRF